jgi:hypothetical protein
VQAHHAKAPFCDGRHIAIEIATLACGMVLLSTEEPMRKISLYAVAAAVMLAGAVGIWAASTTQARIAPTSGRIDTMQMMSGTGNLATEHFVDYSLVFN